jgi:hypothetical protein
MNIRSFLRSKDTEFEVDLHLVTSLQYVKLYLNAHMSNFSFTAVNFKWWMEIAAIMLYFYLNRY